MTLTYETVIPWTKSLMINESLIRTSDFTQVPRKLFAYEVRVISESDTEHFSLSDSEGFEVTVTSKENISSQDKLFGLREVIESERIDVTEARRESVTIFSSEEIDLSDELYADVEVFDKKYLGFFDEDEDEETTTISNIEVDNVYDVKSSFDEYVAHKSPTGYSALRPLYPGDYEYGDAIIGLQVTLTDPESGSFGVVGCRLHVDVEDVVDKGSVELEAEEKIVPFSKSFFTIPKVFGQVVTASEPARVVITYVTNEGDSEIGAEYGYFKIGLKAINSEDFVSGTVNWLADGY